ncbi:MAG: hypothetical protein ACJAYY_001527 [Paraglaciecola sp.]|jgi:hypothetical protein|uniref:hypothetical protein n=1 Tax=Polaribacter sp. TaxID=1920175 RepID=UPI003AE0817D
MALINRQTLKNYFRKGGFAKEKHFIDLIDSSLNSVDDGISKTPDHGLKLSPAKETSKLISFFNKITQKDSDYSINLNSNNSEGLSINKSDNSSIIKLNKYGQIGVNTNSPNYNLEVNGTIGIKTQVGLYKMGTVPADGNWHYIISDLDGISALEVTAKASGKIAAGFYAVSHAIALSTFGGKRSKHKIKTTNAYYESYFRRLSFRWIGDLNSYGLQVKTRTNYGINSESKENYLIKYNIINLLED